MAKTDRSQIWANGDAYERFMGRWSRISCRDFVKWLAPPNDLKWLDVGCGTGAFSEVILEQCTPNEVVGIDAAEALLAFARLRISDDRVQFIFGDAMALPFDNSEFHVAASAFVLNFVADKNKMVSEMKRVVRPLGTVASCVWDFAGGKAIAQHMGAAVAARDPDAAKGVAAGQQAESTRPEALSQVFQDAGLDDVRTLNIDIAVEFEDFDDYWSSNTGFTSPIGRYVSALTPKDLRHFIGMVKERLPFADDGSICYTARAPAVRGIVPQE